MPDEEPGKDSVESVSGVPDDIVKAEDADDGLIPAAELLRLPRVTPVTVTLIVFFIIGAVALPGVPADARESIYQQFFTLREGRSGLGLPVVQRVMERLGGRVGLASSMPGAVFFLELPASTEAAGGEGGTGPAAEGV